ncbi:hypothetical protein JW851_04080 [Candidatus Woesearchaeota archaeon]|nr:hypothetical protein [Candidatus Woesearchaeota archaeon]
MDLKNNPLAILVIVTVIGIAGLMVLYNSVPSGQVAVRIGGQKIYGASGMAYSTGDAMSCETLTEYGRVPVGFDYEAPPSDAVNRFGLDKCVDARDIIGYYCCSAEDLY